MIAQDLATATASLEEMVHEAGTIVPFTGAGISTECGIPDFRSPGGLWTRNRPIPFDEFVASAEARDEAWRRRFAMEPTFSAAKPGRGHRALASLYKAGKIPAIITQNIDNLHQAGGVPDEQVIELHGNTRHAKCLTCGARVEIADIRLHFDTHGEAPDCKFCGGIVKTATISFGQAMPEDEMARAEEASLSADLFLVAGSSLAVYPAASFPLIAKRAGARLVILNREETQQDPYADLVLHREIGPTLTAAIQAL